MLYNLFVVQIIYFLHFNQQKTKRTKSKRQNCSLSFRLCSLWFVFIDYHRDVSGRAPILDFDEK